MKRLGLVVIVAICLGGCATGRVSHRIGMADVPGVYHEVIKGQTLWHISKIYEVDLRKIINTNRLPDASKIEVGQLIFVPDAREEVTGPVCIKSAKFENFIWPVKGRVVSYFGSMKKMARNNGIDIETRDGVGIVASRSGKVTYTNDNMKGYGKTIIIDHLDGFQTVYAHNAKNLVRVEEHVARGQVIAKAGKTGRADEPTLHFEIRKEHKSQNPFYYLP